MHDLYMSLPHKTSQISLILKFIISHSARGVTHHIQLSSYLSKHPALSLYMHYYLSHSLHYLSHSCQESHVHKQIEGHHSMPRNFNISVIVSSTNCNFNWNFLSTCWFHAFCFQVSCQGNWIFSNAWRKHIHALVNNLFISSWFLLKSIIVEHVDLQTLALC